MDEIEVVIKIPEEDYMFIKSVVENGYKTPSSYYYNIALVLYFLKDMVG